MQVFRILGILLCLQFIRKSTGSSNHKHFTIQISEELSRKTKIIDLGKLASKWFPSDIGKIQETKPLYKFQFFNCEKTSLYFEIDSSTGVITIERRIDRDNMCHLVPTCCPKRNNQCHLDLTIKSDDDFSHIIVLVIDVKDINDNAPLWNQNELITQFSEGSEVGDSKSLTVALDNDAGSNGISYYSMSPEISEFELSYIINANSVIYSNKEQLKLVLKQKIDREKIEKYEFTLTAFDGGNPSYNGSIKVIVIVTDENDNSPIFEKSIYLISVNENLQSNSPCIQVKASDADSGMNGKIEYQMSSLTKPEYSRLFSVEPNSGYIRVRWELDYETYTSISLVIEANDMGNLRRGSTCTVVINIKDLNDNSPEIYFEPSRFTDNAKIIENEAPGKLVAVFSVQDKDSNENGKVTCHLDPILNEEFSLDRMNIPLTVMYKISTIKSFDREKKSKVTANIVCFDEGHPRRTTSDSVSVGVEDVNDEAPFFSEKSYTFYVNEDVKPGTYLFSVNATDKDEGLNALLSYSIFGKDANKFSINKIDGKIFLESDLDREQMTTLFITIKASDSGFPKQIATTNATVIVQDINDNYPSLPKTIHLYILENHTSSTPIVQINVTDYDEGLNSEIKLTLISETANTIIKTMDSYPIQKLYKDITKSAADSLFLLLPDGKLLIRKSGLDRESTVKYELVIEAVDRGIPSKSTRGTVYINVLDVNDSKPKFIFPSGSNSTVKVKPRTVSGTTIAQVIAFDEDEGKNSELQYSFKSNNQTNDLFLMHGESGKITLQQTVKESHKTCCYVLIVVVRDNGNPSLEDTARLRIIIESLHSDVSFQSKTKKNEEFAEFINEENEAFEFKIHNNVVVIIALISAAALFIIMMSLATALLVCRKFKRDRNYTQRHRFHFKQSFRNWRSSMRKSLTNKRQQETNQVEPISGQSLIQKKINNEERFQINSVNKSNQSYFLNPLTIEYGTNSTHFENQDLSINLPKYSIRQLAEYQNEILIPGVSTYFNFNRSLEGDVNSRSSNINENIIPNNQFSLSLTESNSTKNGICELSQTHFKPYTPRFISGSNV